ncbi:hypothetical protein M422DRAFT_193302 [Sphaerobolus stellatus SS14]|uniref:Thiolase C-terminal domain-containing protein n=1 Tax=Sphaerobolus stellatus (strain SS14) TaxID=990650 RepID=A0A0C9U980_SPHS4|nr:hypothetical protein M422DRAFT_193302 [Sphaerobolus stellatus SS14]
MNKVNPKYAPSLTTQPLSNLFSFSGGLIALAHPLGMTGVRMLATGFAEIQRRKQDIFCTSMCIGSGMGLRRFMLMKGSE